MKLLFDRALLTEEQGQLLAIIVSQKNGRAALKELLCFESEDDALVGAVTLIVQEWAGSVVEKRKPISFEKESAPGTAVEIVYPETTEEVAVIEKVAEKKTRAPQKPSGTCQQCQKPAVLIKALGICRPCNMKNLKHANAHPGDTKVKAGQARNSARIDAAIEKVVAKAKAAGTLGGVNIEKTAMGYSANGGNGLHCRKVG